MNLFYTDVKMTGRNRNILLKKLKKHKIKVLKLKSISEKELIIRISPKDNKKVFAFFSDMWYNQTVKTSLPYKMVLSLKKRLVFFACIMLSFLMVAFADKLYFSYEIKGQTKINNDDVNRILTELDVKKYRPVDDVKIALIKDRLFSAYDDIGYVDIKKISNRLVIEIYDKKNGETAAEPEHDLVSVDSGEIYSVTVLRGTAIKKVGERVDIGDKLIEGVFYVGENAFSTYAQGTVVLKKEYFFERAYQTDSDKNVADAVAIAFFLCGSDSVIDQKVEKSVIGEGVNISVTLTYLVSIEN